MFGATRPPHLADLGARPRGAGRRTIEQSVWSGQVDRGGGGDNESGRGDGGDGGDGDAGNNERLSAGLGFGAQIKSPEGAVHNKQLESVLSLKRSRQQSGELSLSIRS